MTETRTTVNETTLNLIERLAVIETKLDSFLAAQGDHEARLRRLERWRLLSMGAAAVLGGAAGNLAPLLGG